jgi:hypothetical protein
MPHKESIQGYMENIAMEVFDFIREEEVKSIDGLVKATHIKDSLELNFAAVPRVNANQTGQKGWLFSIIARMLEDRELIQYEKRGGLVCRTKKSNTKGLQWQKF